MHLGYLLCPCILCHITVCLGEAVQKNEELALDEVKVERIEHAKIKII